MKSTWLSLALAVAVTAHPNMQVDFSKYKFQAPKATDLRGPFELSLSLSRHNWNVCQVGFTTGADIESFTLEDIRLHNNIEHDASISRADLFTGDNFSFNKTLYSAMVNANSGLDNYDPTSAGLVQKQRLLRTPGVAGYQPHSDQHRKGIHYSHVGEIVVSSSHGDVTTGKAPKKFASSLVWWSPRQQLILMAIIICNILVQKQRLMESQATSPTLINTLKEINIRVRESSLYRAVMGNVTAGIAQKKIC
ncbi:hypothetical protein C8J56DRAFT_902066 [Mycena floridula]|nr:hypothetical protein C8J56DRAFT_902066 [Mycena floridula]